MKTILRIFVIACFACVAGWVYAQSPQASVNLPLLSFVVDATHHLRPLIGIPGSASIGAPIDLGVDVIRATASPSHDYILAMTRGSNWPVLLQLRGGTITAQSMDSFANFQSGRRVPCSQPGDGPLPRRGNRAECSVDTSEASEAITVDQIVLSPAGSAAAFFSESQKLIYAFTNLSQSPALLGKFDVGALGPLSALAISDDGKTVAVGTSDGVGGSVFILNSDQQPRLVASIDHPSLITFLHNSDAAVIADDANNKIYMLSGGQAVPIATAADGISTPTGIAVSNNNQRIFVANSGTSSITTIGPSGMESQNCNCVLTGLHSTNADSVYRLTDYSGGPVLLFDAGGSASRMTFVR